MDGVLKVAPDRTAPAGAAAEIVPNRGWFGDPGEAYPSDLYRVAGTAEGIEGFGAVHAAQVERFHEQGYLVVHHAFKPAEVSAALQALTDLLNGKRPDFDGIEYEAAAKETFHTLAGEGRQDAVRKFWRFVEYDPRLKALSEHPALLQAVARLIGGEPEMFQDMALLKPPRLGREKPWHQDLAYFRLPTDTAVVGVWIALDPATLENGCMQIMPLSHRQGPVPHFKRRDWQICDRDVAAGRALAVPLEPGGCLFFHGLLHHGTPANRSPHRRRALQFHYKPRSVPWGSDEDRLAIFGGEGRGVEC